MIRIPAEYEPYFTEAVEVWGKKPQLSMVEEEALELAMAIIKLRRARRRYNRLSRYEDPLKIEAVEKLLTKAKKNVIEEWADVTLMLQQLPYVLEGEYQQVLTDTLNNFVTELELSKQDAGEET